MVGGLDGGCAGCVYTADFKKSKKQLGIFNRDALRLKSIIYINMIPMEFPGFIQ